MSKNQRLLPPPRRFRQRRSGNLPRSVRLVNNFFQFPKVFFGATRGAFLPGAEARTYLDSLSLSTTFFVFFFKKPFRPASLNPSGLARLRKTFRPAAARTGYAPLGPPCQRLFRIFFAFFSFTFVLTVISLWLRKKRNRLPLRLFSALLNPTV